MAKRKKVMGTADVPANTDAGGTQAVKKKSKEPGIRVVGGNIDIMFFLIVIVLLVYGLVMMFSASYMEGLLSKQKDGFMFVRTQAQAAIMGVLAMMAVSMFDYHILYNTNFIIFVYAIGLGILTYTTFFGVENAGARRWIEISSFSFQPSEMMKPLLVIFISFLIVKNQKYINDWKKGILPLLIASAPVFANMVFQRHISGLLIMAMLFACVVFLSDMDMKVMFKLFLILGVGGLVVLLIFSATRENGLSYIFDRFSSVGGVKNGEINDKTWQTAQSLIAMGSGGWFGLGFGASRQKYLWLPESQNDFIISVIVEELGYIGGLTVVLLFALLVWRGFRIAKNAPDKFGTLIVSGITFQIGIQAILNIGVACNAFPNTGVSLPFFSSGGTALAIQLVEMGVILAVSRQCENV